MVIKSVESSVYLGIIAGAVGAFQPQLRLGIGTVFNKLCPYDASAQPQGAVSIFKYLIIGVVTLTVAFVVKGTRLLFDSILWIV